MYIYLNTYIYINIEHIGSGLDKCFAFENIMDS